MKKIKIFLASSITDLREDRLQVGDFIRQLNELYLDNGIHFSLVKCEDYDNAIAAGGKQSEFDREIRESDLIFFLFFKKVGDYTRHEFEVALDAFKTSNKPKIITYFKYVNTPEEANEEIKAFMALLDGELKHYYNTYNHIDALKLGMLMQIKLMKLDATEVKLQDGAVTLNGKQIAKAENVPILRGNETLMELTRKKTELTKALNANRAAYLADPTPENETAFFNASAELNEVSKQLTEIEKATMEFMSTVAEMTSDGKVLTYRQKEALKYYDQGNYDAAQAILSDEERENELERAENKAESARNEIQGYVNEDLLWIKTEKTKGVTADGAVKIREKYEKVVALVEKHDLDKAVLYDYASFLYEQKDYTEAVRISEKLGRYYNAPDASAEEDDVATLYNLLGVLYSDTQRYAEAEDAHNNALEIFKRLSERNPDSYEPDLADSYNNLGNLYSDTQRYAEAEDAHNNALEIRKRLAKRNPDAYEPGLAMSYNNLGNLYSDTQRYAEAEDAHNNALEIFKRLSERNPDSYEPDLATSYNNLGCLYDDTQRYAEAEEAYNNALEIRKRLAKRNPDAYEPDLATSYNNLGNLYYRTQRYAEAEDAYNNALEIRKRLAKHNPDAFEPDLATSLFNMSMLYYTQDKIEESKPWLEKALEIYERLEKQNPGLYQENIDAISSALSDTEED